MALQIFETDPEARPAPRESAGHSRPDIAFNFRSGMQVPKENGKGTKPLSLSAWRVLTHDQSIADGMAELYGGTPEEYDPSKDMNLHVLTEAQTVNVVIDGPGAIEDKLILWGPNGPLHECDGVLFLSPPEEAGQPCGCPPLLKDRKKRAADNRGPKPAINVTFKLAGKGEDMGTGKLTITAWTFVDIVADVKNALAAVGEPALCELTLEHVEFPSATYGLVSYNKPVIKVLGSYNDAISEER
ncbi:hypothetical protein [Streptomyces sp. NBC_01180]|uniref:recombination directionality factor n=1 Tax=Streptomyces sp. NBC_01180 TaxID=2903763 RepID=UPI0038645D58|nr:hypothetical protein OG708_09000 [Streptomyces sp. NBC_01180]